jgi:hypothetical protein
MHTYLQRHPEVFLPLYKEPHYFGSDLTGRRFLRFRDKTDKYLSLFQSAGNAKCVGESSACYLVSKKAAQEIKAFDPNAKIIIMLRSPLDMMYSLYSQYRYSGNEQLESFEQALDAEPARKQGHLIRNAAHCINGLFYREMASYTNQVKRYLDIFGQENVHIIIFDDLKASPASVFRKTLQFLKVEPSFQTNFDIVNPNKVVRMNKLQGLLFSSGFSPMLLKDQITYWATTNRLFHYSVFANTLQWIIKLYTKHEKRNPIDNNLRSRVQRELKSEIDRLSALLDRDLTHWYLF